MTRDKHDEGIRDPIRESTGATDIAGHRSESFAVLSSKCGRESPATGPSGRIGRLGFDRLAWMRERTLVSEDA
jgi:hypothetical protein